ncbi:unnamed protein product, partial [Adineta steineri]
NTNSLECYFCGDDIACPFPFHTVKPYVKTQPSSTGWCAKISTTEIPDESTSRGPAEPDLCTGSGGCEWTYDSSGTRVYACCCQTNLCNKGHITSKSTISILFGALTLLLFNRYF